MASPQDFFDAIRAGDLDRVRELVADDRTLIAARSSNGLSPVLVAAYYAQPTIADFLIDQGAPLDVFEAAATGRTSRVEELTQAQPDLVNAFAPDGFQPLGLAAYFGHLAVVELLLSRGAEVNSPAQNPSEVQPLHSAAAGKHLEIAERLLAHGADANARQAGDFTPLHSAAQNRQPEMVRLLLAHGASPDAKAQDGKTPFDLAQEVGDTESTRLLQPT